MSLLNYILGIATAQAQVASGASEVAGNTGNELSKLIANFFASIPLWIAAIVVAFFSYILAVIVKKALESKLAEQGIEEEHKEIKIVAGRSAFFGVLIIGITVSLSIVGIDLKPIVAAGAFGLGFALQDIIMNLISGMFILASRHYTIGDVITVGAVTGRIEDIQTRATIIRAFDGTKVIVPNSDLFSNVVISKTSNPYRKLSFSMGVGYGSNLTEVMQLTLAVVKSIPWVLKKPKASVIFSDWGDSTINFKINVWIDSKGGKFVKVKNRVIMDLTTAYSEAGFDIPYPIQTILMDKADETEIKQDEISSRVKALKAKYKAKNVDPSTLATPVLTLAPALAGATSAPVLEAAVPITPVAELPVETAPTVATAPGPATPVPATPVPMAANPVVLPVAIQTTPNSPGQSWLQQALTQQITSSADNAPVAPVEATPPVAAPVALVSAVIPATESAPVAITTPVASPALVTADSTANPPVQTPGSTPTV